MPSGRMVWKYGLASLSVRAHLIEPIDVTVADYWGFLNSEQLPPVDAVVVLAPENLSLDRLWVRFTRVLTRADAYLSWHNPKMSRMYRMVRITVPPWKVPCSGM